MFSANYQWKITFKKYIRIKNLKINKNITKRTKGVNDLYLANDQSLLGSDLGVSRDPRRWWVTPSHYVPLWSHVCPSCTLISLCVSQPLVSVGVTQRLLVTVCLMNIHASVLSSFTHLRLFENLWAVARQAPLSMGFSRKEYWSGLPCPPPGHLPNPGTEPTAPALTEGFFATSTTWEALHQHSGR